MGLFDFIIGKKPDQYNPDFSQSQKVITDLEQKYGQAPTAVDQTGQLSLDELDKSRDVAMNRTLSSVESNRATTQGLSNLQGSDSMANQSINRASAIGSLSAMGGVNDSYSQLSDLVKSRNLATQEGRYFDVNTNVLPKLDASLANKQIGVGLANEQIKATNYTAESDMAGLAGGVVGGVVGGYVGGPSGAYTGATAGAALGQALY